jgi:hypothetical protein
MQVFQALKVEIFIRPAKPKKSFNLKALHALRLGENDNLPMDFINFMIDRLSFIKEICIFAARFLPGWRNW